MLGILLWAKVLGASRLLAITLAVLFAVSAVVMVVKLWQWRRLLVWDPPHFASCCICPSADILDAVERDVNLIEAAGASACRSIVEDDAEKEMDLIEVFGWILLWAFMWLALIVMLVGATMMWLLFLLSGPVKKKSRPRPPIDL